MPHRIMAIWYVFAQHGQETAILSGLTAAFGGLSMWAMTAEAWGAAIFAVGCGIAAMMVRVSPAVAQTITVIGRAVVDLLVYKQQAMREQKADMREVKVQVADNHSAIVDLRAEAEQSKLEAAVAKEEAAEAKRLLALAREEAQAQAARRKAERELQNGEFLRMDQRIRELDHSGHQITPRVARNEQAIDELSAATHVPVTPPPEPEQAEAP